MWKAERTEKAQQERRRSRRYFVQIPVILRAIDTAGRDFFERTTIISVDQHGARIRTPFALSTGDKVEVQLLNEKEPRRFHVVWFGGLASPEERTVGLEFIDVKESWNLEALRGRIGGLVEPGTNYYSNYIRILASTLRL